MYSLQTSVAQQETRDYSLETPPVHQALAATFEECRHSDKPECFRLQNDAKAEEPYTWFAS
jgi:hypothetical protein